MNVERQTGRFVVKAWLGSKQLPSIPCSTDDAAMQGAFRLFGEHGRDLEVEIHWNDRPQYGPRRMAQFYAQLMRDRRNAFATASDERVKRLADDARSRDKAGEMDDPFAVFIEWASEADEKAYSRL